MEEKCIWKIVSGVSLFSYNWDGISRPAIGQKISNELINILKIEGFKNRPAIGTKSKQFVNY